MEGLIKLADGLVTLDMQVSPKPADLVVIVPSRGRPEAAAELVEAFAETATLDTRILFAVNDDDPTLPGYEKAIDWARPGSRAQIVQVEASTMVEALNLAAINLCIPESWTEYHKNFPPPFAVGFMGDDHRPRTKGWDEKYVSALRELGTGIVYGDDLLQGKRLPTQCAMTVDIVRAMGFMAPCTLKHMYVDDFWRDLGTSAWCLKYLPGVVIEHMHPAAGKAEMDDSYLRVNNPEVYNRDGQAYDEYKNSKEFRSVVEQIRNIKRSATGMMMMPVPSEILPARDIHEWRLFKEGTVPEYTRPEWYAGREHAPHLEQGGGHRERLLCSASLVAQAAFTLKKNTVVDLGCGDGGLLSLLGPAMSAWGYDLMDENVEAAKDRGVDVRYGDVVEGDIDWGSIAVCTEMLEHLVDPHAFLRRIAERCSAIVCSSPWDERAGSAYEFHAWAWDLEGYRALVEQAGFKVLRQRTASRFQVILAIKP